MLTSLLPGFRDLRTPLVAGGTILLTLWLIFKDTIPAVTSATGVAPKIYALANLLGPSATLAVLSFVAYLVGSVVLIRESPRCTLLSWGNTSWADG